MENFYDAVDLKCQVLDHLESLIENKLSPNTAALLTKAYAQSKFITAGLRNDLIERTNSLQGIDEDLKRQLPLSTREIYYEVLALEKKRQLNSAIVKLHSIEQDEILKYSWLGRLYEENKEFDLAKKFFQLANEKGNKDDVMTIQYLYKEFIKYELLEEFYSLIIDNRLSMVPVMLLFPYFDHDKPDLAMKMMTLAKMQNDDTVKLVMASVFYDQNKNKKHALDLIKTFDEAILNDEICMDIIFPIKLWCGLINEAISDIKLKIKIKDYSYLHQPLIVALFHNQTKFVYSLFKDQHFGNELINLFQPTYYATCVIANENITRLKIPPELQKTIYSIIEMVKEKQIFYYGSSQVTVSTN